MSARTFARGLVPGSAVVLSILLCLALAGSASAEEEPSPAEVIAEVDWNRDGRVDRREFFDAMVYSHFTLDANRDGFLTLDELEGVSQEDYDAADHDRDGKISVYEYVDAYFEAFEIADENGDGLLDLDEVTKHRELLY